MYYYGLKEKIINLLESEDIDTRSKDVTQYLERAMNNRFLIRLE